MRGLRSSSSAPRRSRAGVLGHPSRARASPNHAEYRVIVEGRATAAAPDHSRRGLPDRPGSAGQRLPPFRRAGTIELELEYGAGNLRLFVRDDGCGIDAAGAPVRAARGIGASPGCASAPIDIGAAVQVRSRAGAGTEVELIVPGDVAFETGQQPRARGWLRRDRGRINPSRAGGPGKTDGGS